MSIFLTALYGAICGYVASRILGGEGYGLLGNIVVGILGGFVGSWLIKLFKIPIMDGAIGNLVTSVGGAIVFLIFLRLLDGIEVKSKSRK